MNSKSLYGDMEQRKSRYPADPIPGENSEEELDIRELLQKLNRRRHAVIGIFLLVLIITGLHLYQATPMYTAVTQLTLDIRKANVVNVEEVLSGISTDDWAIATELDIIRSSSLLAKVADKLNLQLDPLFNPALLKNQEESLWVKFKGWLKSLWFPDSGISEEVDPEEAEEKLKKQMVGRLQGGLRVEHLKQSYTFTISFTSPDPKRAAQVANTVAELYLMDQLETKFEATRMANEWLAERLEDLRQEVKSAELAAKNLRQKGDMIQAGGRTILEQQIADVNAQLIQARVAHSRARTRLEEAMKIMNQQGGIESLGEVLESEVIQQLRTEETALRRKKAELSQRYGSKHPQMIQIQAEMEDLQNKLKEEVNRVLASLENEVRTSEAEVQSLQESFNKLRVEAGSAMQVELELNEMERNAQASRQLYQNFLDRFKETQEQDSLQRPDARIISPAEVPAGPSYPKKKRTMVLGMAAGLILGIMGAFLLEMLDRGFRTGDQVEKLTGIPVLGMIPSLPKEEKYPEKFVLKKPHSAISEALRGLRTAIHLSNVDHPPKSVMVTSSIPMEGKSTICLAMGYLAALAGNRVLVIDADMRLSTIKKRVSSDIHPKAMLEDVLQGKADLKEAISIEKESGLHLILSHGKTRFAGELLGSEKMAEIIRNLFDEYDLIIIDTPPVMGVSDAWNLAGNVDSLIYVVQWAETTIDVVRSALHHLKNMNISVTGIVLNQVDVRQESKYGYYGSYYGKYKKYYHE